MRRVFIMDDAEQFLPLYLRFVKGVLDSADLPLNVSRELLQADSEVEAMRAALTKRVLELLGKLAKDEPAKYQGFWREFGTVLKEGLAEDPGNRDKILPLLRFANSNQQGDAEETSLAEYVARMQTGQDKIYYVVGESLAAARSHPAIEGLRARNVEVLLLGRRIDAWVMDHLQEFEGKKFKDATRGDLELGSLAELGRQKEGRGAAQGEQAAAQARQGFARRAHLRSPCQHTSEGFRRGAGGRRTRHLRAACGVRWRRLVRQAPAGKPVLELNVEHHLVKYLEHREDAAEFDELALVIYEQAMLAEGAQLPDPGAFVQRLNRLWARFSNEDLRISSSHSIACLTASMSLLENPGVSRCTESHWPLQRRRPWPHWHWRHAAAVKNPQAKRHRLPPPK